MIIINSLSTFGHKTITTRPGAYWTKIQSQYDKNPKKYTKNKRCSTCVVCYMVVSLFKNKHLTVFYVYNFIL